MTFPRVAGGGWQVTGDKYCQAFKNKKNKNKKWKPKKKKDNKHYKKRYFSNILLLDIACTR